LALAGPLNTQALSEKLSGQPTSRAHIASTTIEGIGAFAPLGSGLGTYQDAYRAFDDPNRVSREFTNHAHNDYLEVAFELGIPGLLVVLAFIAWWAIRSRDVWRADFEGAGLARAGSAIVFIVLLHSIVDYPIRTSAIAALFALACGWLIPYSPPLDRAARPAERKADEPLRHLAAD
ncbi:O-antigen ligase family protein, partial [Allosphingosinicella sp.]|uniref:O-antigen ligase family protein n=1 Tax=Allosphingosinicella sp. TaxID=2823234 RepID=UPI002EEFE794